MGYAERATGVPGVVLWTSTGGRPTTTILPDGCLDLIWDGDRVLLAGPDTHARRHDDPESRTLVGLRFSHGRGPSLLGVPAHEVRDTLPGLDDVWPVPATRALVGRLAAGADAVPAAGPGRTGDPGADPTAGAAATFTSWVRGRADDLGPSGGDAFGPTVFAAAATGGSVATIADELGVGARTLHRRCLPVFGYGPQHLARVLRLGRALELARGGRAWAEVAATTGHADQAHLVREVRALTGATPTALLAELLRR